MLANDSARRQRIIVRSVDALLSNLVPDVWHDIDADVVRPFRARDLQQNAGGWFPITITHHTVSYQRLLHSFYIPLVLDAMPTDTVVCTSRSARDAIGLVLDHVSEQLSRRFETRVKFRGRLEVIPLGVDTEIFQPRDAVDARLQLGLPRDAFILLWNGRVSFIDKADLLPIVRVFSDLVVAHPSRRLHFVLAGGERAGENAYAAIRQYARQLHIAEAVQILGEIDLRLRPQLYNAADVFVSPADNVQETFGITPLEAMACGVPQVVADWDGYRDTVQHGATGFLVPTYWSACAEDLEPAYPILDPGLFDHLSISQSVVVDPGALRNYLDELIRNQDLRSRMRLMSRRRAVEMFAWQHVISQYEQLWGELAALPHSYAGVGRWYLPSSDVYRGYPSQMVPSSAWVRLTQAGKAVLRGGELLPCYWLRADMIDLKVAHNLLHKLETCKFSIEVLARELSAEISMSVPRLRRHIMWLVKYGFAKFQG